MTGEPTVDELWELVGSWVTLPDVAEAMNLEVTRVRQLVRDGSLIAIRRGEGEPLSIPADFVGGGQVLKSLPSVLNLLRDARYTELEMLRWLYTEDDSLPGSPVQALVENRGTEVKRRAQALGF
ncbi:MAG TPA: Rv2175c family DNA-binding protein [Mycobacteriales bacterium]|nr:Rv2175c family DNA-binding protein [Mycobacteriales bacterium]